MSQTFDFSVTTTTMTTMNTMSTLTTITTMTTITTIQKIHSTNIDLIESTIFNNINHSMKIEEYYS